MTDQPKILAFTGSLRKESVNKKVLDIAIEGALESQGDVTFLSLKDYPLPLYDQDVEEKDGIPENAKELKNILRDHDGLLIASPEYNSSYSAALKNVIDWTSRPESSDEPMLECYRGKVAAIMSASPGALGGLRGLSQLRFLLENIFVFVIPQQQALPSAFAAFDENGNLKDEVLQEAFKGLGSDLVSVTRKLLT
jgi:chromate reductase, NAD(P)H dehydrogenase (quinone)